MFQLYLEKDKMVADKNSNVKTLVTKMILAVTIS